jgi:uncharacterized protein YciI
MAAATLRIDAMRYFALFYEVVEDFPNKRVPFRGPHLQLAQQAHDRGEIVLAGALGDPADRALIIFRAADKSVVENFVNQDPYVANGLVARWEISPWTVVIGNQPEN